MLIHSIPCFVKLIDLPVVNTAQFMNIPTWSRASLNDLNTIKLLIICITCEYAQCMCGVCNSNVLITCISAADPYSTRAYVDFQDKNICINFRILTHNKKISIHLKLFFFKFKKICLIRKEWFAFCKISKFLKRIQSKMVESVKKSQYLSEKNVRIRNSELFTHALPA